MENAEMTRQIMKNASDIAAVWESSKSAHKRLNENDRITAGIHELAKSVATIATEIKGLTAKLDESVERIENGQRAQGERLGRVEHAIAAFEQNAKDIEDHEKRLNSIEKEPGQKWKDLVKQVIALIVAAAVGGFFAQFFGG
jgi:chromosome segregation ATPase